MHQLAQMVGLDLPDFLGQVKGHRAADTPAEKAKD